MRIIVEAESRLYTVIKNRLYPTFNDHEKSMVRRQDVKKCFKVYNTDIFRGKPKNCSPKFLGDNISYVIADKICGLDIDDEFDFVIASSLVEKNKEIICEYL